MTAPAAARPQVITALPLPVNLELYAGDDFALLLTVAFPDGTPYPLETAGLASHIRPGARGDLSAEFTIEPVPADPGAAWMRLGSAVTAALPARAVWDVQLDGERGVITLAAGTVTVTPEVTR